MKKRILSLLMAVLMIVTLVPTSALAVTSVTVTFTKQPADVTVNVGETATFTAEAKASLATIKYVWIDTSDVDSSGKLSLSKILQLAQKAVGTDSTLTIENVTAEDNGKKYECIAYCSGLTSFGYAVSNTVTLTVKDKEPCAVHTMEKHEAKAATCAAEGNVEYYYCTVCQNYYLDENGQTKTTLSDCKIAKLTTHSTELEHHDRVEPTCCEQGTIEYWQCPVCEKYYSDAEGKTEVSKLKLDIDKDKTNHSNLTEISAKAPTCTEKGNIACWYCNGCDNYYSDAAGNTEIKKSDAQLSALGHDYQWTAYSEKGVEYHAQKCSRCDDVTNTGTHSGGEATCSAKAVCTTCEKEYGELNASNHVNFEYKNVVEATETQKGYSGDKYCADCGKFIEAGHETDYVCNHVGVHHEAVAATCQAAGSTEYWQCSKCGKYFSDEAMTAEIEQANTVVAKLEHYKTVLGQEIANSDVYAEGYSFDANGHYRTCKYCEFKFASSAHSMTSTTASCVSGDSKCMICDYTTGTKDPTNHVGETEVRGAHAPTADEDGYTGDTYCLSCGEMIKQGNTYSLACSGGCKNLELVKGTPKTCTEDGTIDYYECTKCHNKYKDAKGTVSVSEDELVDKCTGHDLHPGVESLSDLSIESLKNFATNSGISASDIVQMIKDGTFDLDHILDMISIKDIDHCYDDEYHWLGCQRCGKTLEDLRDELESSGATINEKWYELSRKTAHTGGTATCKNKAVCDECGEAYGNFGSHRYDAVVTAPKCTEKGYTTHTCSGCGNSYKDNYTVQTGHIIKKGVCESCKRTFVNPFTDVKTKDYYYSPVMWAYTNNPQVTNGTDATHFSPSLPCTRAQVVTFLWRAAGKPAPSGSVKQFVDVPYTDSYAYCYDAILWAVENGITKGTDDTHFSPDATVTRAQFVTFLYRYAGEPSPQNMSTNFSDLGSRDAYYYKAVVWAAENGITTGTGATTFSPNEQCTRGQVVTFLFRAFSTGTVASRK
jgi:hypothetical protein